MTDLPTTFANDPAPRPPPFLPPVPYDRIRRSNTWAIFTGVIAMGFFAALVTGLVVMSASSDTADPSPSATATEAKGFAALNFFDLYVNIESRNEDSISMNFSGHELSGKTELAFQRLLEDLGFNVTATMARIGNTRALDGSLSAEGTKARAYWTYHPDDGLSIVFERK